MTDLATVFESGVLFFAAEFQASLHGHCIGCVLGRNTILSFSSFLLFFVLGSKGEGGKIGGGDVARERGAAGGHTIDPSAKALLLPVAELPVVSL